MKSSALCRHPLTKKRWNPENLVSVLLIPLHCEGKAFPWELSKYHSSASCCKDFLHGGRGVCARARACVCICMCVYSCVCACVCLSLWEGKRIGANYDHSGFRGSPRSSEAASACPLGESAQAGKGCRLVRVCYVQNKDTKRPRSQSCFCHFGLSHGLVWRWEVVSLTAHSGPERGRTPSGFRGSQPSATARGQEGPTAFCALVCD